MVTRCTHWGSNGAPSREEKTSELGRVSGSGNHSAAVEMGNDEFRVGDGIRREGGCVLTGHRGAQSLGCLADRKREGPVLLNLAEMGHRIPDRKSTRLNSSHIQKSRMPSSA